MTNGNTGRPGKTERALGDMNGSAENRAARAILSRLMKIEQDRELRRRGKNDE